MSQDSSLDPLAFEDAFLAVQEAASARGISVTRLAPAHEAYLGLTFQGAGRCWDLHVDCKSESLTSLPSVFLDAPRQLHAHVSYSGNVCFSDLQGLSIDPDRREELVAFAAIAAFDLLEKWAADPVAHREEFFNELEAYWLHFPGSVVVRSAVEPDALHRTVVAAIEDSGSPQWYLVELEHKLIPKEFGLKDAQLRVGMYVHLDELPDPPAHPHLLEPTYLKALVERFSSEQQAHWQYMLDSATPEASNLVLFVSTPRAAGGVSMIGMAFSAVDGQVDLTQDVIPLSVRRHTASYMRERGGASKRLLEKRIAVIGCGSVGSVVADSLAACGVGRLTLIDADRFTEDNVFRHVLGPNWIDLPKVSALKAWLVARYPGLNVTAVSRWGQTWLQSNDLSDVDGVVFALGLPTLERDFCRKLRGKGGKTLPMVFTWLEPLDLGGHSVAVWSDGPGCLDCLYRDEEGAPSLISRVAFMEPNQPIAKNLTGCASIFVEYGALQARRTGLMAAEHLLKAIQQGERVSYHYWVGDGDVAQEHGLRTTPWRDTARTMSFESATEAVFGRPCKTCRPLR